MVVAGATSAGDRRGVLRWAVLVVALVALVVGCGEPAPATPDATVSDWRCPATWVRHARGGCGPAVLLCVPDGGAAAGACDGVDLSRPPMGDDRDGGVATGFWRAPDGAIRGGWKEPGEPGGPPARDWHPPALDGLEQRVPAADWAPDAGIPSCPDGWARTSDGVCDPRLPEDCPEGSGPLPGGQCTRTALRDCPAGEWADPGAEAVGAQVLRVREGADDGSADGSAARPYGSITAALAAAEAGAWVLVGAGRYPERLRFQRDVHLVGVCAARVTIAEPTPFDPMSPLLANEREVRVRFAVRGVSLRGGVAAVVAGSGSRLDLRRVVVTASMSAVISDGTAAEAFVEDLSYDGSQVSEVVSPAGVLSARAGGFITASRCHIARPRRYGARCVFPGSMAVVSDSIVLGSTAVPAGLGVSAAIAATNACAVVVRRSVVLDSERFGLLAYGPEATLRVDDAIVRRTRAAEGDGGFGLYATFNAQMSAERVFLDGNETSAVIAHSRGTLLLENAVVRRTRRGASDNAISVAAGYGGRVDVRRTIIEASEGVGAAAFTPSSELAMADSIVRDTSTGRGRIAGIGLAAMSNGWLEGRRLLVQRSAQAGAHATTGGVLRLESTRIQDVSADNSAGSSVGLAVDRGGELGALHLRVQRVMSEAVWVADPTSRALLSGLWLDDTAAGRVVGLHATAGGHLAASRVRVGEGYRIGVAARGGGARIDLVDAHVAPLTPSSSGVGFGALATEGGVLDVSRALFEGGYGLGVVAQNVGSRVVLRDAVAQGFRAMTDGANGVGVLVGDGATASLTRVLVRDTQQVGVLQTSGSLELVDAVVESTRPLPTGLLGHGVSVAAGTAALRRVLVRDHRTVGLAVSAGATLEAHDMAVLDTTPTFDGTDSAAIIASGGARVSLATVVAARSAHSAIIAQDRGTHVGLEDTIVNGTRPTRLGFGVGVASQEGASLDATRTAIVDVSGFALGAVVRLHRGATIEARELFVAGVSDQSVRNTFPPGMPVAYGIAIGAGCGVQLDRATVVDAGWGFFQTAGRFRWREGVVLRTRDGPGAVNGVAPGEGSTLDRVRFIDSENLVISRDVALPEVLLPPPPPPCALPPCGAR